MEKSRRDGWIALGFFAFISLFLSSGLFVDEKVPCEAIRKYGYTECVVQERAWFLATLRGCSREYAVRFDLQAKNLLGQTVNLSVCAPWAFFYRDPVILTDR